MFLLSFKYLYFAGNMFYTYLHIFLLSYKYFFLSLNICTFLQCFCFPANKLTFQQTFFLSFIYLCFHSKVFEFLPITFYFPANILTFLNIFLVYSYILTFIHIFFFPSNVFALFFNFSFP